MKFKLSTTISYSAHRLDTLHNSRMGFTLMELLIGITIIAIISTIGYTVYSQSQLLARDAKRKEDLRQIKGALMLYYNDYRAFPSTNATQNTSNWLNSSGGGFWIPDLDTDYIDRMPQDPIGGSTSCNVQTTSNCYFYAYFTLSNTSSSCPEANQHFILAANLENVNDPAADRQANYSLCDGTSFSNNNLFITANNN